MRVQLDELTKTFGQETAVDDLTLEARSGELTTLVGPSGCGKTTTLRMIAGLERPDTGTVSIGDNVVTDLENGIFVPPQQRDIGIVFQNFDVWPHMNVFENVAFPLRLRGVDSDEIEERVMDILDLVDIQELAYEGASHLSGGQQTRVGISRALVYEPKILLCDEPLTGLDRNLREDLRYEIRNIQQELETTTIYVTHSQPEAMAISDTICLMRDGRIEQRGGASDIYNNPVSEYSFTFFGGAQLYDGDSDGDGSVTTDIGTIETNSSTPPDGRVTVGLRPEKLEVEPDGDPAWTSNVWEGTVSNVSFLGETTELVVEVNNGTLRVRTKSLGRTIVPEDSVQLHIEPDEVDVFARE